MNTMTLYMTQQQIFFYVHIRLIRLEYITHKNVEIINALLEKSSKIKCIHAGASQPSCDPPSHLASLFFLI